MPTIDGEQITGDNPDGTGKQDAHAGAAQCGLYSQGAAVGDCDRDEAGGAGAEERDDAVTVSAVAEQVDR